MKLSQKAQHIIECHDKAVNFYIDVLGIEPFARQNSMTDQEVSQEFKNINEKFKEEINDCRIFLSGRYVINKSDAECKRRIEKQGRLLYELENRPETYVSGEIGLKANREALKSKKTYFEISRACYINIAAYDNG